MIISGQYNQTSEQPFFSGYFKFIPLFFHCLFSFFLLQTVGAWRLSFMHFRFNISVRKIQFFAHAVLSVDIAIMIGGLKLHWNKCNRRRERVAAKGLFLFSSHSVCFLLGSSSPHGFSIFSFLPSSACFKCFVGNVIAQFRLHSLTICWIWLRLRINS